MVDNTSIMAHRDAELEGGGDHLIDRLSHQTWRKLLLLMAQARLSLLRDSASPTGMRLLLARHLGGRGCEDLTPSSGT
jgi:hypothetical protein